MRWLPVNLIQCRFSSGQRVPLLVQTGVARIGKAETAPFRRSIRVPVTSTYGCLSSTRYRSLTDSQLQIVRILIRLGTAENPIPERLQLRNWLISGMRFTLLLFSGLRV
jgi:hypothetical protein